MQPTHNFNPSQQTIILNAVQSIIDSYGSALILNSSLAKVHQDYTDMKLEENAAGDLIYVGTIGQLTDTSLAFKTIADLCLEIDQAIIQNKE